MVQTFVNYTVPSDVYCIEPLLFYYFQKQYKKGLKYKKKFLSELFKQPLLVKLCIRNKYGHLVKKKKSLSLFFRWM